jgi:hypothetical protein
MKHRLWIAMGLMLMESALVAAPLSYSENFNSWGETWLELSPSATTDYWYRDEGALVGGVTWGPGGVGGTKWMWAVSDGWAPQVFNGNVHRNFRTAGTLAATESITNATLTAYVRNGTGSDVDSSLYDRLSLLDNAGNGYVGTVDRAGGMSLYKSAAGVLTSIGTNASGVGGNAKYCTLSVIDAVVTLSYYYDGSPSTVYTTTAADGTYGTFTALALGGHYGYWEGLGYDNVTLTGATVIPEPATAGLLAVAGALVLMRRRKQG